MMLGAIADDFTGATDVAVAFRRAGLRVAVGFGVPANGVSFPAVDAVVIALKSRTIPAADAVAQSRAAKDWLLRHGAERVFFKFCSTFDSTPEGNIGPVSDALADELDSPLTVVVPSSPEHDRTQYYGYLFAGPVLLSESSMRHHPLTPMTDSSVPRLLATQTDRAIGLVDHATVRDGEPAVRERLAELRTAGARYAVVDAITPADLVTVGAAVREDRFLTGAAGLAEGLGAALAAELTDSAAGTDPVGAAPGVVLAGSCSRQTLAQIARMQQRHPSYRLDAVDVPDAAALAAAALDWYDAVEAGSTPLIYSSLPPDELARSQRILGAARGSEILETAMGLIADGLVRRGVGRVIVAGGETSGSVVTALGVRGAIIGSEEAPGVPWLYAIDGRDLALLLKSGNFGDLDFFERALARGVVSA